MSGDERDSLGKIVEDFTRDLGLENLRDLSDGTISDTVIDPQKIKVAAVSIAVDKQNNKQFSRS